MSTSNSRLENQKVYQAFYKQHQEHIPIFASPWWLNMWNDTWDCALYEHAGNIIAALPYSLKSKWGMTLLSHGNKSPYSQLSYFTPKNLFPPKEEALYNKVTESLLTQLPKGTIQALNLSIPKGSTLPFIWEKYTQQNRYTYTLNLPYEGEVIELFQKKTKSIINKYLEEVTVQESIDVKSIYPVLESSFKNNQIDCPHSLTELQKLTEEATQKECGKWLIALRDDKIISAIFLLWDSQYIYYFLGGSLPEFKKNNANTILLYHAINFAQEKKLAFNFEAASISRVPLS